MGKNRRPDNFPFHWKIVHPGAVGTQVLIFTITYCEVVVSMYLAKTFPRAAGYYCLMAGSFVVEVLMVELCWFYAMHYGPGYVPKEWTPPDKKDTKRVQYCELCKAYKAPRSHHCRTCNRCVLKMDHHCPWINDCVGHKNHKAFLLFIIFCTTASFQGLVMGMVNMFKLYYGKPARIDAEVYWMQVQMAIGLFLDIGVFVGVGFLTFTQLSFITTGTNDIEEYIIDKAENRGNTKYIHPYTLPTALECLKVVMGESYSTWLLPHIPCPGDGITWRVIPGTDQYSFTEEQLLQKKEKMARVFKVAIKEDWGGWLGIGKGVSVACDTPAFERRLTVYRGDIVDVYDISDHWVYGQVIDGPNRSEKTDKGWFPRLVVQEKDDPDIPVVLKNSKKED
eukprot:Clim_evm36s197 gene=Clim_evmTU36s197